MVFFCYQVVNQYSYVSFRAVYKKPLPAQDLHGCVDPCVQSLGCRFFITGTSVKLSSGIQAMYLLEFKSRLKLKSVNAVIFDRIRHLYDACVFQSRYSPVHSDLHVFRHTAGHSVDIHLIGVSALRLYENLVRRFIGKTHYLVLDGGAVAGTGSLDLSGEERRAVQILSEDLMGLFVGMSQVDRHLFNLYGCGICFK